LFSTLKIKHKIAFGYSSIILATVIVSILMLIDAVDIKQRAKSISSISTPTVQASTKMSNAINAALASLRGWILIEEKEHKVQRENSWLAIREAETEIKSLSLQWDNKEYISSFKQIQFQLNKFEKYQIEIEDIAHKPSNIPASNILLTIAAPLAQSMSVHITKMIDLEKDQKTSAKRKKLLLAMANTRGNHGYELASIRAYLLSSDQEFKDEYNRYRSKRNHAYTNLLKLQHIMTSEQKSNFKEFTILKNKFDPLPASMFSIRDKPNWNKANYKLKTTASPAANKILTLLSKMIAYQNRSLVNDSRQITNSSQNYVYKLLLLSLIVAFLSIIIGLVISRNIENELNRAVIISKNIAKGDFNVTSIKKDNNDSSEVGELMNSLSTMANDLSKKEKELIANQLQIIESNKLAAIGGMAANIAHEINSPLQAISIYTYKINKNNGSDKKTHNNKWAEKIDFSVEKISNIIESLLKISRNTKSDPLTKPRIDNIINDVLEVNSERFKLSSIIMKVKYHNNCESTLVECHYTSLCQVVTNLINNAYDAVIELKEKWVSIEIIDFGDKIEISVSDSGKGIPLEMQDKIFQAMYTSKDIGKGTGIGLSISSEIIKQHNGYLSLDSESENTRFVITLPKEQNT
jgi:signal transduction histidine kinase